MLRPHDGVRGQVGDAHGLPFGKRMGFGHPYAGRKVSDGNAVGIGSGVLADGADDVDRSVAQGFEGRLDGGGEDFELNAELPAQTTRKAAEHLRSALELGDAQGEQEAVRRSSGGDAPGELLKLGKALDRLEGALVQGVAEGGRLDTLVPPYQKASPHLALKLVDSLRDRLDGHVLPLCHGGQGPALDGFDKVCDMPKVHGPPPFAPYFMAALAAAAPSTRPESAGVMVMLWKRCSMYALSKCSA